jgi:hypothetical protein
MQTIRVAAGSVAILLATAAHAGADGLGAMPPSGISAATHAYFDALASADAGQLDASVTPSYRSIDPHGSVRNAASVYGTAAAAKLEGSPPQGALHVGTPDVAGDRATESATWQTYSYAFVDGRSLLVRRFSAHALTLQRDDTGAWRVAVDRVTEENTYY